MTFPIENLCFFDFETKASTPDLSDGNVKTAGTARYAQNAYPIILTYAIGEGPVKCVALDGICAQQPMVAGLFPQEIYNFGTNLDAKFVAWTAAFDRAIWNATESFQPYDLLPAHTLDAMVQAVASNLPAGLGAAGRALGLGGKQADGSKLISMFCAHDGWTATSHPAEWELFKSYAVRDTALLRDIWKATRPLPLVEWQDYWVNERINDRGMEIDLHFAARAAAVAEADTVRSNAIIADLTGEDITKITQAQALAQWIYDRLDDAKARDMLVKEYDDEAPEDEELKPARLSVARDRIEKVLTYLDSVDADVGLSDMEWLIYQLLELRQFGGSSSPQKFSKMLRQHVNGRLMNQYVLNGAAQTGRYSSRGVQVHNLFRKSLGAGEVDAMEMINQL